MRTLKQGLINARSGDEVAHTVWRADTFLTRLRGLIGRPPLAAGCALWISPCNQIHTHFLGYAIDAVFLDADWRVLKIDTGIRPWRILPRVAGAASVLEFCGLRSWVLSPGDRLIRAQALQPPAVPAARRAAD